MGTKINTTYYGLESSWTANSSWGDDCKRADGQHTFLQLAKNGQLDLANEGNINFSAVPWGVPRCSLTNHSYPLHLAASPDGNFKGFYKPINEDLDDKNNPLVIVSGGGDDISYESGQSTTNARAYQKMRVIGKTAVSGNNLVSTLGADNGTNINSGAAYGESVITYLNYQTCKVIIDKVYLIDKDSVINGVTVANNNYKAVNFDELTSETYDDNWICVGVSCKFVVNNNLASDGTLHPVFANPHKTPLHIRNNYSNDTMQKWVQYHRNVIKSLGRTDSFNVNQISSSYVTYADANTKASNSAYACSGYGTMFCNTSAKQQAFDDVSYKWDMRARWASGNIVLWLKDGEALTDSVKWYNVLDIPDNSADKIFLAVLHEVAFLGFPFVISEDYINEPIGSSYVHLPIFDYEHMVTTGRYVRGTDSLQLNNALWQNIFDDNIPNWDPSYEPPEGGEVTDGDSGDLTNRGLYTNRFSNPSYTVWAFYGSSLGNNGLDDAIAAINNLYITDPDGNEKWTLDFKGSNPSDYIVGLYAYPLAFATSENSYTFTLGAVPFDTINVKHYADNGFITFGSINFNDIPLYGDFRDYPPYSTAELYIPFCGTVDIDLAFFIGHSMSIDMYYDIYTGACSAAIYRDNITLYKVVNGQIGVQLPLTSMRAGDYQNNIHALENALKQNEMRLATSALTLGLSAGAAVATGGASLAVGAGVVTGSAGLLSTMQDRDNIEYKLDHTAPTIAQTGAAETQNGYRVGGIYPTIFIKHAAMIDSYEATIYSQTVGNACCITNVLGDNKGLTVCSKIDTDGISKIVDNITISPTADEINAIKQAVANGIIV